MSAEELRFPRVYQEVRNYWAENSSRLTAEYTAGRSSFLAWCPPQEALARPIDELLGILKARFGAEFERALEGSVSSPADSEPDPRWITRSNIIGINVRTVGSFWGVIPYLMTVPGSWNAVHLLPIWEPGVVGSLYGISSWEINPEFYSPELAHVLPELDSVEAQLRFVINLIHLSGRTVGLDVIPHTDRFSQIVLAQPWCFEWLQREDLTLIDHGDHLTPRVQEVIYRWLLDRGPAAERPLPSSPAELFSELDEQERNELLFGVVEAKEARDARRDDLVERLYSFGYEPVPATMAPPFRGLEIDPETRYLDSRGRVWRDYRMQKPQAMSRVFGPLTRYRLYAGADSADSTARDAGGPGRRCPDGVPASGSPGSGSWELDFSQPVREVWDYVADHYADICARYGFDFMRGDMSHVQMRPDGVPENPDTYYDALSFVKQRVADRCCRPGFAYYAESFLAARDVFGYGEELDHLEASRADAALGDLQAVVAGTPQFMRRLARYLELARCRACTPSFTVITGDKDDPRFDEYFRGANVARYFTALFLTDMPSYIALGFEMRDIRMQPAPNDYYTKLYVFQEQSDSNVYPSKAVHGPYRWNTNGAQFAAITRVRLLAERLLPEIAHCATQVLLPPDPENGAPVFAWTHETPHPRYCFVLNFSVDRDSGSFGVPVPAPARAHAHGHPEAPGQAHGPELGSAPSSRVELIFTSRLDAGPAAESRSAAGPEEPAESIACGNEVIHSNGYHYRIENLRPGEARVYRYCY